MQIWTAGRSACLPHSVGPCVADQANAATCSCPQVMNIFSITQRNFPGAAVQASTLDAYFGKLLAAAPHADLPVVTGEIGDSWIYGGLCGQVSMVTCMVVTVAPYTLSASRHLFCSMLWVAADCELLCDVQSRLAHVLPLFSCPFFVTVGGLASGGRKFRM